MGYCTAIATEHCFNSGPCSVFLNNLSLLLFSARLSARSVRFRRSSSKAICNLSRVLCAKSFLSAVLSWGMPRIISCGSRGCLPNIYKNGVSRIVALNLVLCASWTNSKRKAQLLWSTTLSMASMLYMVEYVDVLILNSLGADTASFESFGIRVYFATDILQYFRFRRHDLSEMFLVHRTC